MTKDIKMEILTILSENSRIDRDTVAAMVGCDRETVDRLIAKKTISDILGIFSANIIDKFFYCVKVITHSHPPLIYISSLNTLAKFL